MTQEKNFDPENALMKIDKGESPYIIINMVTDKRFGFRLMSKIKTTQEIEIVIYFGNIDPEGYYTEKRGIQKFVCPNTEELSKLVKSWIKVNKDFIKQFNLGTDEPKIETFYLYDKFQNDKTFYEYMSTIGKVIKLNESL